MACRRTRHSHDAAARAQNRANKGPRLSGFDRGSVRYESPHTRPSAYCCGTSFSEGLRRNALRICPAIADVHQTGDREGRNYRGLRGSQYLYTCIHAMGWHPPKRLARKAPPQCEGSLNLNVAAQLAVLIVLAEGAHSITTRLAKYHSFASIRHSILGCAVHGVRRYESEENTPAWEKMA